MPSTKNQLDDWHFDNINMIDSIDTITVDSIDTIDMINMISILIMPNITSTIDTITSEDERKYKIMLHNQHPN